MFKSNQPSATETGHIHRAQWSICSLVISNTNISWPEHISRLPAAAWHGYKENQSAVQGRLDTWKKCSKLSNMRSHPITTPNSPVSTLHPATKQYPYPSGPHPDASRLGSGLQPAFANTGNWNWKLTLAAAVLMVCASAAPSSLRLYSLQSSYSIPPTSFQGFIER